MSLSIQFPGSRQYNSAGEPENASELSEVAPNELVKVIGTREACQQAIDVLSTASETPSRSRTPVGRNGGGGSASRTVSVPAKFFHALTEQGLLARQLRQSGIQLDLPTNAPAKVELKRPEAPVSEPGANSARIDEDQEEAGDGAINYAFEEYDAFEGYPDEEVEFNLRGREEILEKGEKSMSVDTRFFPGAGALNRVLQSFNRLLKRSLLLTRLGFSLEFPEALSPGSSAPSKHCIDSVRDVVLI